MKCFLALLALKIAIGNQDETSRALAFAPCFVNPASFPSWRAPGRASTTAVARFGTSSALSTVEPSSASSSKLFDAHRRAKRAYDDGKDSSLPSPISPNAAVLTYLELNGWLLTLNGVTVLIDPVLEGSLDFGIPAVYEASKRILPTTLDVEAFTDAVPLGEIDCLLLTQGLDDHAHVRTLTELARRCGRRRRGGGDGDDDDDRRATVLPIVAPPSARGAIEASFGPSYGGNVRYVSPGDDVPLAPRSGRGRGEDDHVQRRRRLSLRVTSGALVGPPWQARENGYILRDGGGGGDDDGGDADSSPHRCPSIYIEPHVEFDRDGAVAAAKERDGGVDVVITPIEGQGLPAFELVHGPKDAARLVEALRPRYVVPMGNGDIDARGPLSKLVTSIGSGEEFRALLRTEEWGRGVEVLDVTPGEDNVLEVK